MANLFVLVVVGGNHIFGRITEEAYVNWFSNKSKLLVKNPALTMIQPVHDRQTKQVVGYNMSLGPVFPEKTKQDSVAFDATVVEVLSPIEVDEGSGNEFCREQSEMFMNYVDWANQWRAEMSGLVLPGKQKIVTG